MDGQDKIQPMKFGGNGMGSERGAGASSRQTTGNRERREKMRIYREKHREANS